jgi:hypothetical protein
MRGGNSGLIVVLCCACSGATSLGSSDHTSAPPTCAAFAPAETPVRQWVHERSLETCGTAAEDGSGKLAFETIKRSFDTSWIGEFNFLDSNAQFLGARFIGGGRGSNIVFQQQLGFATVEITYLVHGFVVRSWDTDGQLLGEGQRFVADLHSDAAPDPRGGVLLSGRLSASYPDTPKVPTVMLYRTTSAPELVWGPRPLDSTGAVLGSGVDLQGRSLVITDGSVRFGAGHISAQWFDPAGSALTGEFDLFAGPFLGEQWFEGWPLIGEGLLLVRRTFVPEADRPGYSDLKTEKIAILDAGATQAASVPAWMSSRPNTRLQIVYGGRAYAVVPLGARNVPCTQRLEIVAPDGTVCGARDYAIAEGTCSTKDLVVGANGTVIQALPDAMETAAETLGGYEQTCSWRWWPRALR